MYAYVNSILETFSGIPYTYYVPWLKANWLELFTVRFQMYMIWFIDVLNVKGTLISSMFY